MGWFGLPRDTQEEYIFALCPGAKTSLTAQSPSPAPQEAPRGVFQKFSPAAQAADSGLYGSHNVPAVVRAQGPTSFRARHTKQILQQQGTQP